MCSLTCEVIEKCVCQSLKKVKVIDSVRAKKALECVEAIQQEVARHYHPGVKDILKAYGFMMR